ncbi:hypothetical protein [Allokutzneria oryzae]|uniref:Signal transduction histidine kinase subgroup 3 dimerisation and phosphoacceptor domain-containing protein n=1 Tax=Allokutzneria oryzae TaxID=1378989 RepID=A0ABV6A0N1_9PSEU
MTGRARLDVPAVYVVAFCLTAVLSQAATAWSELRSPVALGVLAVDVLELAITLALLRRTDLALSPPPLVLTALAVLGFGKLVLAGWPAGGPAFLACAALFVLPARTALAAFAAIVLAPSVFGPYPWSVPVFVFLFGGVLYVLLRFVLLVRELRASRARLTELARSYERERVLRNLRQDVGARLAEIADGGARALDLATQDPQEAQHQLDGVVGIARSAAADVRRAARGYRRIPVRAEVLNAAELLRAAGIPCRTRIHDANVPAPTEDLFVERIRAWVADVLKSTPRSPCSIQLMPGPRLELKHGENVHLFDHSEEALG